MKARVYKPKPGARVSSAVAQRAGEVLSKLDEKHRGVSAESFLDAAKKDSILRKLFEWDDSAAATKWRLHQARQLMGCFTVVVVHERREIAVPGARYVDSVGGYVPSAVIYQKGEDDLLAEVLAAALRDAQAFVASYGQLRGVAGVGDVVKAIEAWVDGEREEAAAE